MKPTLFLLLVVVGVSAASTHVGRHRRNGASQDPDVVGLNCITRECAPVAMEKMQKYQEMFKNVGPSSDPRQLLLDATSDPTKISDFCTDYTALLGCPAEKCTLTEDIRALIAAIDYLDYICDHQEDLTRHSQCIINAYTKERIEAQFAPGTKCGDTVKKIHDASAAYRGTANEYLTGLRMGGGPGMRRRRQLIPQITENPFPQIKAMMPTLLAKYNTTNCEQILVLSDCIMKPIKDDCEDAAETFVMDVMKDLHSKQEAFFKAFAPGTQFPDLVSCTAERNAAQAFWKLFFF